MTLGNVDEFLRFFSHCEALGFQPALVVDVGVGEGTPGLMSRFPKAHFLLVEPLEEYYPTVSKLAREYDATFLNCALGSTERLGEISIGAPLETSSTSGARSPHKETRPVEIRRLDDLKKWEVESRPIFGRISVQGAEQDVLNGGRHFLEHADLIVIECSCFRFRGERQPILHEMIEHMNGAGYSVLSMFNLQYRPYDMAMASVDVAFARRKGSLMAGKK
ncbi:FkbM family methyltransferase [Hansschlegelia zhihuaiae]|uniref:FkbM family methyltransferase n=1 Tax=Hansschlegelia zhihuaiae TaxID=405005 RepID=A0A4V1KJK1_9HYPH|nr:FkbM family methyltransferase [Hansschlegelia zhihuaiae]RXF74472.1 FkbM family methyltransferase [Hansschlegelia zhihuaiae]